MDGYCDRLSPVSLRSLRSLRKKNQRSYRNHSPAIAAKTITEIELFVSQRSLSLRSLERGFHMITMIAAIAQVFFLSDRSDHSDGSDHMGTGL